MCRSKNHRPNRSDFCQSASRTPPLLGHADWHIFRAHLRVGQVIAENPNLSYLLLLEYALGDCIQRSALLPLARSPEHGFGDFGGGTQDQIP